MKGTNKTIRQHDGIRRREFMSWMAVVAAGMASASAQETNKSKADQSPRLATPKSVINLWPGVAPRAEQWKQPRATLGHGAIANVTMPTLHV